MLRLVSLTLATLFASLLGAAPNLDIYWVDVEGGGATLIVSPSGESLLVDTGWAKDDRDANEFTTWRPRWLGSKRLTTS